MTPVLKVESISKEYQIGVQREQYTTLRDTISNTFSSMLRGKSQETRDKGRFVALEDINFEVNEGEVVGVIGRNGAGKSTLLKIISRITEPSSGRILYKGRIGTLLEVGTGFHPELTGRENIYMNGAILGMSRSEINRKFDEIVDFSEIEKFIDTPVKRYSSGMYVRLAFAVASSLEPDILLVDEVLAVGDAAFQRKCLGRMSDVAQAGRTILFVSHQMASIQSLCTRAIILEHGKNLLDGAVEDVVPLYLRQLQTNDTVDLLSLPRTLDHWGKKVKVKKVMLKNTQNQLTNTLLLGETFSLYIELEAYENVQGVSVVVGFDSLMGINVATTASEESQNVYNLQAGETLSVEAKFDNLLLNSGEYTLRVGARYEKTALDLVSSINLFEVTDYRNENFAHLKSLGGVVRYVPEWQIVKPTHKS